MIVSEWQGVYNTTIKDYLRDVEEDIKENAKWLYINVNYGEELSPEGRNRKKRTNALFQLKEISLAKV
jgi:hypothetical protein